MSEGGWIKLGKDLITDPRVHRMARNLCNARALQGGNAQPLQAITLVLGGLAHLWILADAHVSENDTLQMGPDEINERIGIEQFCSFMPREWLQVIDANNVKLSNYQTHNGPVAKFAALNRKRVAAHRKRHGNAGPLQSKKTRNAYALTDKTRLDKTKKENPLPLCEGLDAAAWSAWLEYRRETKHPLRPVSYADAQLALAKHGGAQMAVVRQSIANGWQGLFELKTGKPAHALAEHSARDAAAWAEARARAASIGFREPWPQECAAAYMTEIKTAENRPQSALMAHLNRRHTA